MVNLIENYIYFYHLDEFCIIPVYPDSVTDSLSANFNETNSLARTAPIITYSNSGPRTLSFNFKLHRDLMNDVNKNVSNLKSNTSKLVPLQKTTQDSNGNTINDESYDYIDLLVKHLQSVSLPKYSTYDGASKSVEPPMIAIKIGETIFCKGVVKNLQVTYQTPINRDNKYMVIELTFSITEVDPYDATSIVSQGSFRGLCDTNNLYN